MAPQVLSQPKEKREGEGGGWRGKRIKNIKEAKSDVLHQDTFQKSMQKPEKGAVDERGKGVFAPYFGGRRPPQAKGNCGLNGKVLGDKEG